MLARNEQHEEIAAPRRALDLNADSSDLEILRCILVVPSSY